LPRPVLNATVLQPVVKPYKGNSTAMLTTLRRLLAALLIGAPPIFAAALTFAAAAPGPANFVVAWAASVQGPYPVGNATAQPELRFAFPDAAKGATDQSFRLIVRPDIWGRQARIRLSNAFGSKPVTFDAITLGLQQSGSAVLPGTNRPVTFDAKTSVTIDPGKSAASDPVTLAFVRDPSDRMLTGRRLAVSFHVTGETGPMTWHAKALTTSYVSPPNSGAKSADVGEAAFPYSTTSWYFLDALDMSAPAGSGAVVAFGDSITDGTASTINGDDRWPDVFARHMHALYGNRFSVVNAGIGGGMVIGPTDYASKPFAGGPAATQRLDRDVTSLSGVKSVIWLEGINDFGNAGAAPEDVANGVRDIVKRLRTAIPGVRIFMATLTSSLNSSNGGYGAPGVNDKRQTYNQFIRTSGIFDGVIDFDAVTLDPKTGELKAEFQPNSSVGGPGDKLHPNRAGYMAMGLAIDPGAVTTK
jgi:lysophospholipase L1-like esterase